jgi:hypothetical protein
MNKQLSMVELDRANSEYVPNLPIEARSDPMVQAAIERLSAPGPDRFDWGSGNPDIVIHEQPVTAIYLNPYGAVVIRQESRTGDNDDDPFVIFTRENLLALINRLKEIEQGRIL